jgi:formylglycine-generating enzyme required for sulfatase activity
MLVYDSERRQVRLGSQIGRGGESAIYRVEGQPGRLGKIYTTPHIGVYERKLTWMLAHPPKDPTAHLGHTSFAWPLDVLRDERRVFVGYLMPFVRNAVTVLKVLNPRLRTLTLPDFDRRYLHRTAQNLAAAVEALHARDYVIGDLHESNVMVTSSALVTLIDTDSFQVEADGQLYPCIVGKPEYTPPELQGKSFRQVKRTPEHDCFSLGVLIFQLLMEGNHPFRGRWLGTSDPPSLEEKICWGLFPYVPDRSGLVAPPPTGLGLDTLHPEVANLMRRCFVDGHTQPGSRPTPAEWKQGLATAERNLVVCSQGHYYSNYLDACPRCRTQATPRRRLRQAVPEPAPEPAPSPASLTPSPGGILGALQGLFASLLNPLAMPQRLAIWVIVAIVAVGCYAAPLIGRLVSSLLFAGASEPPQPTAVPVVTTRTSPSLTLQPRPVDIPSPQRVTDARGVPMVLVPAGPFEMGSESGGRNEQPAHTVTLDAFYIDRYEVTNARFATFLNAESRDSKVVDMSIALSRYVGDEDFHLYQRDGVWRADDGYADHPVVRVSWYDAQTYCAWRSGRLATEAEWEKAARGTDGREYPWGWGIDCSLANYRDCVGGTTAVGSYPMGSSPYDVMDMAGNVREWVHDWYQEDYYSVSPSTNPPGPDSGTIKVLRGGTWRCNPVFLSVTDRASYAQATFLDNNVGFRCVVLPPLPTIRPGPTRTPVLPGDRRLPDLIITDIVHKSSGIVVYYMNQGSGTGSGDFLIKVSSLETGQSFPGNAYYRFEVPAPGQVTRTGGLGISLIGLYEGMESTISAEIDWEGRVTEADENNNIFQKQIQIP